MEQSNITVMGINNFPLASEGLQSLLSAYEHIDFVDFANSNIEILKLSKEYSPDIILMDINPLPTNSNPKKRLVTKKILQNFPKSKLLVLCADYNNYSMMLTHPL